MISTPYRIDKSTTINATGIVINTIVYRPQTPGTRLQIKIVFNFRLIGNTKNTSFHNLDCTSRQDVHVTARENGVEVVKEIDIAKILMRISII